MNTQIKSLFVVLASFAMVACAGGGSSSSESHVDVTESGSEIKERYQFIYNGCDTGEHVFSSSSASETRRKLCDALQDDSLNRFCASSMRYQHYRNYCN